MKNAILEILLDKVKATPHDFYPTGIEGLPQSAREIASMMSKFIEWCIKEVCTDIDENHKIIYFIWFEYKATYFKNIDELFIYWKENIKNNK